MEIRPYSVDSFLAPDETYHFARRTLPQEPPPYAHSHDFYELFLVEHATGRHWINGETHTLETGRLVFVRPRDVHALSSSRGETCRLLNVLFRKATADHLVTRYADDLSGRFFWAPTEMPASYPLGGVRLERAVDAFLDLQTAHRSLSRIEEFLLTIMTRVIDLPETGGATLPAWLVSACEQARRPEIFRDGAAGFVRAAGRGHEHVCRKTKEHLGVTPSAYINRIRMEHAAHLLAAEEMSVSEVADDCGIENMSHFYRVFRQHYGVTPRAYRRQHQKSPF